MSSLSEIVSNDFPGSNATSEIKSTKSKTSTEINYEYDYFASYLDNESSSDSSSDLSSDFDDDSNCDDFGSDSSCDFDEDLSRNRLNLKKSGGKKKSKKTTYQNICDNCEKTFEVALDVCGCGQIYCYKCNINCNYCDKKTCFSCMVDCWKCENMFCGKCKVIDIISGKCEFCKKREELIEEINHATNKKIDKYHKLIFD